MSKKNLKGRKKQKKKTKEKKKMKTKPNEPYTKVVGDDNTWGVIAKPNNL